MLRALAIDFNSYFASVEQQERPELRGQPVIIVPVLAETTGAIAVSIEAKKLGLKRNARIAEARRQCPGLVVVEARPEVYITYHRRLKAAVETCVPVKKIQSIDELECELTGSLKEPKNALALARRIKAAIKREVGPCLRSSIGIGPNWFLAKLASDLEKPDGLVLFDEADIPGKLIERGVELNQLTGIGENMEKRIRHAGIQTVAQLYAASSAKLRAIWGSVEGARFHDWLHGGLQERAPAKHSSIGHGHVLPPKLRNPEAALGVLHRLLQKAAMRLRNDGYFAGALQLTANYRDGLAWSEDCRFNETQDTLHFTKVLNQLWAARPREYRKQGPLQVGIVLHHLLPGTDHTPDLFTAKQEETRTRMLSAVDHLNKAFGKNSVYFGGAHGSTDYAPMRIAFTRIPQPELEEIDRSMGRRLKPKKVAPTPPEALDEFPPDELQ
uniref:DNA polymerase Y family protein n=1 Tax=Cephaloticoccus sp. TaxID=1985742 RepID=UPI004049EB1D